MTYAVLVSFFFVLIKRNLRKRELYIYNDILDSIGMLAGSLSFQLTFLFTLLTPTSMCGIGYHDPQRSPKLMGEPRHSEAVEEPATTQETTEPEETNEETQQQEEMKAVSREGC